MFLYFFHRFTIITVVFFPILPLLIAKFQISMSDPKYFRMLSFRLFFLHLDVHRVRDSASLIGLYFRYTEVAVSTDTQEPALQIICL